MGFWSGDLVHAFRSQDFQHLLVNKKVRSIECQGAMCQGASLVLDVKECHTVLALSSIIIIIVNVY